MANSTLRRVASAGFRESTLKYCQFPKIPQAKSPQFTLALIFSLRCTIGCLIVIALAACGVRNDFVDACIKNTDDQEHCRCIASRLTSNLGNQQFDRLIDVMRIPDQSIETVSEILGDELLDTFFEATSSCVSERL